MEGCAVVAEAALLDAGGEVLDLLGGAHGRTGVDQCERVLEVGGDRVGADQGLVLAREQLFTALTRPGAELGCAGAEEVEPDDVLALLLRPGAHRTGDLGEVVPGPTGVVRHVEPGLLEEGGIHADGEDPDPERRPHERAVGQTPGVEHGFVHRSEIEHVGDGLEVEQGGAGPVGVDVGLVHLQHLGRVAAGELGGELVPVPGPFAVLGGDGDVLVRLREQVQRIAGERIAQVPAPPVDPDGAAVPVLTAG